MRKYIHHLILLSLFSIVILGCEKEVDLKLNNADPEIVIEGWITDAPGPYEFKVTRTGPYLGSNTEDFVSGAQLIIKDDMGNVDTLVETRRGWYQTQSIQGQLMHSYFLEANVEGKTYKAQNYLPRINDIIASGYEYNDTLIFGEGYYVGLLAPEPVGIGDFYQFRIWRNDSLFNSLTDLLVSDDRFVDGQISPFLFPYPHELGDTVVVEVRAISQTSYDFYLTLFNQASGGGPFGSLPDNLSTNFDNGARGWFGTAASRRDTLIIQ